MTQLFSLENQIALITGATRGIGQSIAIGLAEAGADLVLVQRSASDTATKTAIEKLGRRASVVVCDLGDIGQVRGLVAKVLETVPQIDILVNCAGVQRRAPSHQFTDADWDLVIQVNLTAVFTLSRDVGAHMLTREPDQFGRRGSIINIASLLTFQGGITVPAYAASKGGVAQFTKTMSNEWASKGIAVNGIAPGYIGTDMNEALIADPTRSRQILDRIPAGRWGSPDDFKGPAIFLASRASGYVSGEILVVDGGWMGR